MRQNKLIVILLVSLAFNAGFTAQVVLDWSKSRVSQAEPSADLGCYPMEFHHLGNQLETDLDVLRIEQAEQTRRLAHLMTSAEPDDEAISRCLDRLSATERSIKGAVIETVLAQRATLDPAELKRFCGHVQNRLCAPWVDCRPSRGCPSHKHESESDNADQPEKSNATRRQS